MTKPPKKRTIVPATRLGRFTRLGLAASELALGGVKNSVKNIGRGKTSASDLFLTANSARKLAERLANMRGAAMKMGQILSMEGSDILPPEFADALAILRNSANIMPDAQLRGVLGRELGKGWENRFSHFDYQPIAAASIGQVHRATTTDGRDLALKIQYPGVAKSIDSDLENMATLLRLSRLLPPGLDIDSFIVEAGRQLKEEADYLKEAGNLRKYAKLVQNDEAFLVPTVHDDLSTKRILAMDFVSGEPLESLGDDGVSQSTRDRIGRALQRLLFQELFEFKTMQSDPNFANYLYQADTGRIVLLDFGATVSLARHIANDYAGIASALINDDREASLHYARKLGYLSDAGNEDFAEEMLAMIRMVCEPIYTRGSYDFGTSDMFSRARDHGMDMFFTHGKESYAIPPAETTFLHRKLMGSYMLCTRIKAKVNVRELILPHLQVAA